MQVINAVTAPGAEADIGLLLVDRGFIHHHLSKRIGHLKFPALHAVEVAGIEGDEFACKDIT